MSLRLRLIVAFLVFSVVPLGAMTWYTYTSSVQALRDAAEHDSDMLAGELTQRMQLITAQLGERMEHLMDMDSETSPVAVPALAQRPASSLVPEATTASVQPDGTSRPAAVSPASPPSPAPPAPPPSPAPAPASETAAALEARVVANRLGDVAVMLLNNVELRGMPTAAPPRSDGSTPDTGRRGGRGNGGRGGGGRNGGGPPPGAATTGAASASTATAGAASASANAAGAGAANAGGPNAPSSRGDGPPRGFPRRPQPAPTPVAPGSSGSSGVSVASGSSEGATASPSVASIGPMLPQAADPDRITIDLSEIRREMFRQLSPNRSLMDMEPAERARVIGEINQRLLGIQQGLRISAAAIQKEADQAKREAQASAAKPTTTPGMSAAKPTQATPATAARPIEPARGTKPAEAALRTPSKAPAISGNRINVQRERNGVVRQVNAEVNMDELLAMVFSATPRDRGEVPFAIAKDGHIYAPTPDDRKRVESLGAEIANPAAATGARRLPAWTVVTATDPTGSGVKFGIARPVAEALRDIRRTAVRSAGLGMLFIMMALIAVVPLSAGLTRNLSRLNAGVHRIAGGDYQARVAVKGQDEIGRLAQAFNQMAEDVSRHQQAAIGQERIRRELELGRQIQHDMLPREPLSSGPVDIRGVSVAAGEVGGDFFNYFDTKSGHIALLIGDVSGKGVGAALLMANIQASLRTRLMMGQDLTALAEEVDKDIQANTPGPVYATLFVGTLDAAGRSLRYVNAGHNPQYLLRRNGGLERLESSGLPVGLLAGRGYKEQQVAIESGDVVFCYTDGCVEAENKAGDMFGADALERELLAADRHDPEALLKHMEAVVQTFRGGREPADDATMMIARVS